MHMRLLSDLTSQGSAYAAVAQRRESLRVDSLHVQECSVSFSMGSRSRKSHFAFPATDNIRSVANARHLYFIRSSAVAQDVPGWVASGAIRPLFAPVRSDFSDVSSLTHQCPDWFRLPAKPDNSLSPYCPVLAEYPTLAVFLVIQESTNRRRIGKILLPTT